jgi:hypothetical protein
MTQTELFGTDFPVIDYKPATPEPYTVGSILYASWGYEQTNVNFYLIVARKGDWVTLQPMTADKTHTGNMSGTAVPGEVVELACSFRRRLRIDPATGKCWGCKGPESYMSLYHWEGRPQYFSSYA